MPDSTDRRHAASKKDLAHRQHNTHHNPHQQNQSSSLYNSNNHESAGSVDYSGEPVHSLRNRSSLTSSHDPPNLFHPAIEISFKRPRTTSPPTSLDENSSETETDIVSVATPSSEVESNSGRKGAIVDTLQAVPGGGSGGNNNISTSHAIQHTPLRFSFGMNSNSDIKGPTNIPLVENVKTAVDGLLTEKMLNIAAEPPEGAPPSYMNAVGQVTEMTDMIMAPQEETPGVKEQLTMVDRSNNTSLQLHQSWFLVESTWFQAWKKFAEKDGDIGKTLITGVVTKGLLLKDSVVDASSMTDSITLRPGLVEGEDFEILSAESYKWLTLWYGTADPPIERKVIVWPNTDTLKIELYPPMFRMTCLGEVSLAFELCLSVQQTLADLKEAVLQSVGANHSMDSTSDSIYDLRFWRLPLSSGERLIDAASLQEPGVELIPESNDMNLTLAEVQLDQPMEYMIAEMKKKDALWHFTIEGKPTNPSLKGIFKNDGGDFLSRMSSGGSQMSASDVASTSSSNILGGRVTRSQTAIERSSEKQRGLTGLYNLGNTCFMNAALQCMSNTKELKDYFVSGVYKDEVNVDNPLGMGGAIARVFGELLTKLWSSSGGAWHPREFKTVLSRFSPQFIGYAQQDTQELLAFLLDGLHEDLNRIVKKPYIEAPDWEGGGIKEMVAFAHRQWEIYKLRNDSVIVDLFQGQYRSTLVCPDCGKVSIKFDPFMYLTLPIPNRKTYNRKFTYLPWSKNKEVTEVEIQFSGETSIGDLKKKLADWFKSDPSHMVACDVFNRTFYRIYGDFEIAADIQNNDVTFVYEVPTKIQPVAPIPLSTQSYHRRDRLSVLEENTKSKVDKTSATVIDEEIAVLPVFSIAKAPKFAMSYHNKGGNLFGQPFLVAIKKNDMTSVAAIYEAVMDKYLQHTTNPEQLLKYLNRDTQEEEMQSSPDDWDMLSDVPSSMIIPNGNDLGSEGTVAEIHNGGEDVHIVPDTSAIGFKGKGDYQMVKSKNKGKGPGLHFVVHREDQTPITLKPDGFEEYGEELNLRAGRLAHNQRDPSLIDTVEKADDTESSSNIWPLVYTGGALVCVWPEKVKNTIFGYSEDEWSWGNSRSQFIDPELEAERNDHTSAKKGKVSITINDCLNEFTKEEKLGESDPWYCPQCKDFKQATKKFDLWKVPDILVVHLKRFSSGRISRDKIDSFIDFPLYEFDLTERVEGAKAVTQLHEDEVDDERLMQSIGSLGENDDAVESDAPIYDLYAVDNHYGGLGGGHYTAYAKNPEDDKWYYFDDSSIRIVNDPESEVKGKAAYLLFYRRRTTRPIGGKSREKVRKYAQNDLRNKDSHSHSHEYINNQDQAPIASISGSNRDDFRYNDSADACSDDDMGAGGPGGDNAMGDDCNWLASSDNDLTYDASNPTQWTLEDNAQDTTLLSLPASSNQTGWEGLNLHKEILDRRSIASSDGSFAVSLGDYSQEEEEQEEEEQEEEEDDKKGDKKEDDKKGDKKEDDKGAIEEKDSAASVEEQFLSLPTAAIAGLEDAPIISSNVGERKILVKETAASTTSISSILM